MDIDRRIEELKQRQAKELEKLTVVADMLRALPEPDSFSSFVWPSLIYNAASPDAAVETVKAIQCVIGDLLTRDVHSYNGMVYFSHTWRHSDKTVDFVVNGGAVSPACHIEQVDVIVPERIEKRFKIVCDES